MQKVQKLTLQASAVWKRLTSTFKTDWKIEDYPVHTRLLVASATSDSTRRKSFPWMATVINWGGMTAGGDTRAEALENLRKQFERFKAANKKLPRPGTKVPPEFASTARVECHAELAKDFVKRILGIQWAWISDESSLSDFCDDETNDALIQKIHATYGVDVSDISSGNLADIFDRIAERADLSA